MLNRIKYFIQRGRRGYSDEDLWGFMDYLCDIIPKGVRDLARIHYGCPGELYDEKAKNNECHKWAEILEEIAQGFEAGKSLAEPRYKWEKKNDKWEKEIDMLREKQLTQKFDRGMDLFKKYFMDLWD